MASKSYQCNLGTFVQLSQDFEQENLRILTINSMEALITSAGDFIQSGAFMALKVFMVVYCQNRYATESTDETSITDETISLKQIFVFMLFNGILIVNAQELSSGKFGDHQTELNKAQSRLYVSIKQEPVVAMATVAPQEIYVQHQLDDSADFLLPHSESRGDYMTAKQSIADSLNVSTHESSKFNGSTIAMSLNMR